MAIKKKPAVKSEPIVVLSSNTTEIKMEAIKATAKAVYEVAKALNSVNVQATISNVQVTTSGGTGIEING
jgi:hypothetical protein